MAYRKTLVTPVTTKTTYANAQKWLNIIRFGEYGTVIQFQDDCEYRVGDIIGNKKLLKKYLGPYFKKYILKYIPVESEDIFNLIKDALLDFSEKNKINLGTKIYNLEDLIHKIIGKGYDIGLFIAKINKLLEEPDFKTLIALEHLLEKCKNLSVIIFCEKDLTNLKYKYLLDKCSLIFDNIIFYPLYQEKDSLQFIAYNESMWKAKLSTLMKKEIVRMCGGYLWLIHHVQRFLRDNPDKKLADVYKDEMLLRKLEIIWGKLSDIEREMLSKIDSSEVNNNSPEFEFLKEMHFIKVENNKVVLGIPLLKLVIDKESDLRKIYIHNSHILVDGKDITGRLTQKELFILNLLLTHRKKIINREQIARVIWGDNWEEKYSDWALDRLIYRLRLKLASFGLNKSFIKTVKKKGYIFG